MAIQKSKTVDSTHIETIFNCICTQDSNPFGNMCDCPICMAQSCHLGNAASPQLLTVPRDMTPIPSQKE